MKAILLSLVIVCSVNVAHAACAGYNNYFSFMCRGKLSMSVAPLPTGHSQVFVNFKHNVRASGVSGELLTPGTCSWQERPIAAGEPFAFKTEVEGDVTTSVMNNMMISCVGDSSCVLQMCGTISDSFLIHALNGQLRITYPDFFVN